MTDGPDEMLSPEAANVALNMAALSAMSAETTARGVDQRNATGVNHANVTRCVQNVFVKDPHNIGVSTSGPSLYWSSLGFQSCVGDHSIDLLASQEVRKITDYPVILGGGGLLNTSFDVANSRFLQNADGPVVMWGVGFAAFPVASNNGSVPELPAYLRQNTSNLKLIGLRDYFDEEHPLVQPTDVLAPLLRWVPCASALHPAFERYASAQQKKAPRKRRIGYVRSLDPIARRGCEQDGGGNTSKGLPAWLSSGVLTSADVCPDYLMIEDMLKFLAETEVIVSNSYHAIYWATLLGCKVVLCSRWSTTFDHLKWPVSHYTGDLRADAKQAKDYPGAMNEAKQANLAFAEEVRYQLGLPGTSASPTLSPLLRSEEDRIRSVHTTVILATVLGLFIASLVTASVVKGSSSLLWLQRVSSRFAAKTKASMPGRQPGKPLPQDSLVRRTPTLATKASADPQPLLAPRLGGPTAHEN
jgi:hypothetical protein